MKISKGGRNGSDRRSCRGDQPGQPLCRPGYRRNGYFSRSLKPVLAVDSGDFVTIETLTHHAYDDHARMIAGDPGAESVFLWTKDAKNVDRRGAGPMNASIHGRGAGEGLGVHICTGPVLVRDAEPGDVLAVRILDVKPRGCHNPSFAGRAFGSNAAAWWGFHYNDLLTDPKPREVITIYELDATGGRNWAHAVYNYRWVPQTDPFGVVHRIIDYPGVPVDHALVVENHGILNGVRIPVRPHFGVIAVAPSEAEFVDSIPPGYFGGNIDDWRIGKGAVMYFPVAVPGALFSVGDPGTGLPEPRWLTCIIRCWKPRTNGSCTVSVSRTIWLSLVKGRRARSSPNRRSTARCATHFARCGTS